MRASRASIPSPSPLPSRCQSSRRQASKESEITSWSSDRSIGSPHPTKSASIDLEELAAAAMGISSMPEPRDSLLGFLVYNAVISIAALAGLVRAALVFLDLGEEAAAADGAGGEDRLVSAAGPDQGVVERLQRAILAARRLGPIPGVATTCGAAAAVAAGGDGCSVCLAGFEAEAVVNRLPCGHHFHRGCLETWLGYERATCPLCRAHVPVPAHDTPTGLRYPGCELD